MEQQKMALLQQMQTLENQIMNFEKKLPAFEKTLEALAAEKQELNQKWNETDAEFRERIQKIQEEKEIRYREYLESLTQFQEDWEETTQLKHQIQNSVQALQGEKTKILEKLSEMEKRSALIQDVADAFENTNWGQAAKDFQKDDILAGWQAWREGRNGVLNANVMGAGKTLETVALLDLITNDIAEKENRNARILWVTKKSLRASTAKEIQKWRPEQKVIWLTGSSDQRKMMVEFALQMPEIPWIVINYEQLNNTGNLMDIHWDVVVMDEVHRLKGGASSNPTQVFTNTINLLWDKSADSYADHKYANPHLWKQRVKFFIPLSGSPIQNHPKEMWPYLHAFLPERFPTVWKFEREFCREEYDQKLQAYIPRANLDTLLRVLQGQVIRQDPEMIWAQRPDKEYVDYYLDFAPDQERIYKQIREKLFLELEGKDDAKGTLSIASILPMLTYLREANVWPANIKMKAPDGTVLAVECEESSKIDQAMEILEEIFADDEQAVVWSAQFTGPLDELYRRISEQFPEKRAEILDGRCSSEQAEAYEVAFQQGEIDVLLCNRKSISEGFNLHKNPKFWPGGARHAIFLDLWWNREGNKQAEDRIWREGAEQGVVMHRLFIENSIDEMLLIKNKIKEAMVGEILDSGALKPSEWKEILEQVL